MPASMPARGGLSMGKAPMKPSMANRRKAMMGRPMGRSMAPPTPPMASPAPMSATPMKKGGETSSMHKSEMTAIKGLKSEIEAKFFEDEED